MGSASVDSKDPFCFPPEESLHVLQRSWDSDPKVSSEQWLITDEEWSELRGIDNWDEQLLGCLSNENGCTVTVDALFNDEAILECEAARCDTVEPSSYLVDNESVAIASVSSFSESHCSSVSSVNGFTETQLHPSALDHNFESKFVLRERPSDIKKRKKCLNKQAALRYRQKKKGERAALDSELCMLQQRNTQLKTTANELKERIAYLSHLLS
uniref:BZIP domain-containing protein n=1 Tax=Trichuris muris TaxID=70415 RepID=A0A5S6QTZ8_TRIMR